MSLYLKMMVGFSGVSAIIQQEPFTMVMLFLASGLGSVMSQSTQSGVHWPVLGFLVWGSGVLILLVSTASLTKTQRKKPALSWLGFLCLLSVLSVEGNQNNFKNLMAESNSFVFMWFVACLVLTMMSMHCVMNCKMFLRSI